MTFFLSPVVMCSRLTMHAKKIIIIKHPGKRGGQEKNLSALIKHGMKSASFYLKTLSDKKHDSYTMRPPPGHRRSQPGSRRSFTCNARMAAAAV